MSKIDHILFCLILIGGSCKLYSQSLNKPVLDSAAIADWTYSDNNSKLGISKDGKSISYQEQNGHNNKTFIVESKDGSWSTKVSGVDVIGFSENGKTFIYVKGDTLVSLQIGTSNESFIPNIVEWKTAWYDESKWKNKWIAYRKKQDLRSLVLLHLNNNTELKFSDVLSFAFDGDGRILVMHCELKENSRHINAIIYYNLESGRKKIIWKQPGNIICDFRLILDPNKVCNNVLFSIKDKAAEPNSVPDFWYYEEAMSEAQLKTKAADCFRPKEKFENYDAFDYIWDGYNIILRARLKRLNVDEFQHKVSVDVWTYRDERKKSWQLDELKSENNRYDQIAIFNVKHNSLATLQIDETIVAASQEYAVVETRSSSTRVWTFEKDKYWDVISMKDGTRSRLSTGQLSSFYFSPDNNWLIFYDKSQSQYFSYNLTKDRKLCITKAIKTGLTMKNSSNTTYNPWGLAGWIAEKGKVVIYDDFDLWMVDPSGKDLPINVTKDIGRINQVQFRRENDYVNLTLEDKILLTAFDQKNKFTGFYTLVIKTGKLDKIVMQPGLSISKWAKAKDENTWIIKLESAKNPPNYFVTSNFKDLRQLTFYAPQEKYNWLQAELLNFKQLDGKPSQGILYKPENFIASHKYPVIIYYYMKFTQDLYKFPDPGYSEDRINIPWFVSRGYLVFCPDIYYTKGKTGKSALNSVVAAAKLLSSLPFVDKEKIGIQGHSFGGFETNYIISHTNIFRAACSAAGLSNMVSFYGSQWGSFMETQYYVESLQMHLGTTLWQNQKVYLENSPVLNADRVTTPVLFMANKKDDYCFYQQVEFFNGLRRLNKSSWLLQYDNGAHSVYGDDAFDFTKRMEQFFDHYLEGKLPPKWMTRGIEAKLKYSETGFELDSVMSCSNNCQVCSRIHNRQLNINQVNGN